MKKPLVSLVLTAATVAVLAVPAGAAVPKKPATQTIPCNDGSGRSAEAWSTGPVTFAAKNPCRTQWLDIAVGPEYGSGAPDSVLEVAPGAHFNWSKKETIHWAVAESFDYARLSPGNSCGDESYVLWVYSYKDVRNPAVADPAWCG